MIDPHIAVVGSGSLARSVCYSLAALPAPARPIRVTVLARGDAAGELARICQVRAAVSGAFAVTFAAESLHDEVDALARLQPGVLVCCTSAQSPYEKTTMPSMWTDLIARAGFGVTLPLQTALIVRLARAAAQASPRTLVVNGCFPDVANPLLAALGVPITCGIGNVSTLAACLQAALGQADQQDLALLGHHVHLSEPGRPHDEVRAWHAGRPVPDVTGLLSPARAMDRRELNGIAGHAAARLLIALVTGAELHTSLPGPLGLPGGYPVAVSGGSVAMRLPPGITRAEAVSWNLRVGRDDGVQVVDGRVEYSPRAIEVLAPYLPELAAGWPVAALDEAFERLTELRRRLRLVPAAPVVAAGSGPI
ncbi:potassium transporter TrkA [Micromonospora sp. NPDC023737]|uniref:potassium transporter TrkA n=1 Tax=unclassified Micromonospora TaxID=2617518 RepID=UPI0033C5C938